MKYFILCVTVLFLIVDSSLAQQRQIWSPDGQNKVTVFFEHGNLLYEFEQNGEVVVSKSELGLKVEGSVFMNLEFVSEKKSSHHSTWKPVWGVQSTITDHYNALSLGFKDLKSKAELRLKIRLYNEGLAFKYEGNTHKKTALKLEKECTGFNIVAGSKCWVLNHPWGKRYQKDVPVNKVNNASLPLLTKTKKGKYVFITEAELYNYGSLHISANANGVLSADLVGDVTLQPGFATPWRLLMVADNPAYFVEHKYCIQNLNSPSKIEDISWIKPGICTWDWRARGAVEGDLVYELNTETLLHFVSKTAELGLPYFMVDAEWYGKEREKSSDPLTTIPEIDMKAFMDLAKEKNVGIWLYVNRIAFEEYNIDELLSTYKDWGVVGIKLGFLKEMNQWGVEFLQEVLKKCSEYKIMFNCHECVIPSGIERTWPHFFTREYNHSLEDGKYIASPIDHTITPFLNNVAGPIDVTPGFFDIDKITERQFVREPLKSTVVAQAAMCLTYFSPILCLPDIPEAYKRKADLFEFVKRLPLVYDESKVLVGEIEKAFVVARRKDNNWWLAGVCNSEGAQVEIDMNFLEGKEYKMTLYLDGKKTNWEENREKYSVETKLVSNTDILNLRMAPGGGVCVQLEEIIKK